jgi:ribosomal protein S18 acetylase RimI-like enzyme
VTVLTADTVKMINEASRINAEVAPLAIRSATLSDFHWLRYVWDQNRDMLGPFVLSWNGWLERGPRSKTRWDVVPFLGFVHWTQHAHYAYVREIAVAKEAKRKGVGLALMKHVTRLTPVRLKTDADNTESNAFYQRLGLKLYGRAVTKKGKPLNGYEGRIVL